METERSLIRNYRQFMLNAGLGPRNRTRYFEPILASSKIRNLAGISRLATKA